jgi:hypothetical protein
MDYQPKRAGGSPAGPAGAPRKTASIYLTVAELAAAVAAASRHYGHPLSQSAALRELVRLGVVAVKRRR